MQRAGARAALVEAALRAVQDTDEAPGVAVDEDGGSVDEDGGASNSVNSQRDRNFAGPSKIQQCMAFLQTHRDGRGYAVVRHRLCLFGWREAQGRPETNGALLLLPRHAHDALRRVAGDRTCAYDRKVGG